MNERIDKRINIQYNTAKPKMFKPNLVDKPKDI